MPQVKVWNDNKHPYSEKFKNQEIYIKPQSFIMMDRDDAELFKGTFNGRLQTGDGVDDPKGFKMIRIEVPAEVEELEPEVNALICQACNYEASSDKDLSEHSKATHAAQILVDPLAEQAIAAKKRARKAS